ncbi:MULTISPECIES: DUF4190 domain-containing protein [Bacillaceae]|uniref:DUF4190 domain-containing protein n=1 Tax=Evansella alkalicola TaxID=745819 RepID=A0ABS6JXT4_9BACI|nr:MULTISPECIES: DUF4190 domain-containing protein [Bacillaceae]MBU9723394.1 DUF4190 domain-containing protein [Bacillus alkalicola]
MINTTSGRNDRYTSTNNTYNSKATATLVLGVLSLLLSIFAFLGFPLAVIGLVVGVVSLLEIKKEPQPGKGFALLGILLCCLAFLYPIILLILTYPLFTTLSIA